MIYGELGVYPFEIDIKSRTIAYWTKLIKDEISSTACNMCLIIHSLNEQRKLKTKWLDDVKNLILTNGYGNVWESPYEINANWFKLSFKQNITETSPYSFGNFRKLSSYNCFMPI